MSFLITINGSAPLFVNPPPLTKKKTLFQQQFFAIEQVERQAEKNGEILFFSADILFSFTERSGSGLTNKKYIYNNNNILLGAEGEYYA